MKYRIDPRLAQFPVRTRYKDLEKKGSPFDAAILPFEEFYYFSRVSIAVKKKHTWKAWSSDISKLKLNSFQNDRNFLDSQKIYCLLL